MSGLIENLKQVLGPNGFLEGDDIGEAYRVDQSRYRRGDPALVMRPASTAQVAEVLALCNAAGQPIATQGGMTGLVDAAVPAEGELVLTLERMRRIVELDADSSALTVEAGVPLQAVQEYADAHGFLFPLDLGARGSCTIGGNLSTNAGGNRVIRYGMIRDMTLGVEAVLADGTVIDSRNKTIKNNTGYDLKQLFIGSEGTLGVVTGAVLRLFAKPRSQSVAFCALPDYGAVMRFLHFAHSRLGGTLSAFEVLWASAYDLVRERVPAVKVPFAEAPPFSVLIESLGGDPETDPGRFQAMLEAAADDGCVANAVIAKSAAEVAALWGIRDGIPEALFTLRPILNYDIAVPLGEMDRIARRVNERLDTRFPGHRTVHFGHIGDGNLHVSTHVGPEGQALQPRIDEVIYGLTEEVGGAISAEHGIGFSRRPYLGRSRSAQEIALMRTLKKALDPNNILNPGRVVEIGDAAEAEAGRAGAAAGPRRVS